VILEPGEEVLWTGKPKQGLLLARRDFFMIPFSMLCCGFALAWTVLTVIYGGPWFFTLVGIGFSCLRLYLAVGRFFHDRAMRRALDYHITNRRIVISKGGRDFSIPIGAWPCLELSKSRDGTGTIAFVPAPSVFSDEGEDLLPFNRSAPRLYRISDPDRVVSMLNDLAGRRMSLPPP